MNEQIPRFAAAAFWLACAVTCAAQPPAASKRLTATIDVQHTAAPVSDYLYGGFIEHGGSLIYRSLWSEMLDDRKFYFPISSKKTEETASASGGPFRMPLRKWRPVGPDGVVAMDQSRPFVADQSPRIRLDPSNPHGIRQSGLALVKGKRYTGRIYLRGAPGAKVTVSLVWGDGANRRQSISLGPLTDAYRKFPLSFTTSADRADGALEITGTGSGDFHIGAVSLMPADNVRGVRPDTIALLRDLHAGMWRLPGGNYLSDFNWYHSIGDIDKRPSDFDYAWNAMQTNDVGMDEFMTLCKLIGVDPYISVNAGFGDAHSASEEVEYMNGSAETHMGALRAKNGSPAATRTA